MSLQLNGSEKMLNHLIGNANTLCKVSKLSALWKCSAMKKDVQRLIDLTEAQALQVKKQADIKAEELISAEEVIVLKTQKQKKKEKEIKSLEETLVKLREKMRILENDIQRMNAEIRSFQNKIEEEETKRTDAATDWIPGVGLIGGLITGRYERMIPLYSVISGIVSAISQDKENAERRCRETQCEKDNLNGQLQKNENAKNDKSNEKSEMEKEIVTLRDDIAKKEEQKKELGKNLTSLKNKVLNLKTIIQKQVLMQGVIKMIKFLIFENAMDEEEVKELIEQLESIRLASRAINEIDD